MPRFFKALGIIARTSSDCKTGHSDCKTGHYQIYDAEKNRVMRFTFLNQRDAVIEALWCDNRSADLIPWEEPSSETLIETDPIKLQAGVSLAYAHTPEVNKFDVLSS